MHKILTFNLPDTQAQWICGANGTNYLVGEYKTAGLPNITGYFNAVSQGRASSSGCVGDAIYNKNSTSAISAGTNGGLDSYLQMDASRSSSIYGNAETVRPRSVVTNFCIKY